MTNDDKPQYVAAMKTLQVATGGKMDDEVLAVFWEALREYPLPRFLAAAEHLCKTKLFFPKLAEWLELLEPRAPNVEETARHSWDRVVDLLSDSARAAYRCEDETACEVVRRMGGFQRLGALPPDQLVWEAKRFVERYVEVVETNVAAVDRLEHSDPGGRERIARGISGLLKR